MNNFFGDTGYYLTNDITLGHAYDAKLGEALGDFFIKKEVYSVNDLGCGPSWYASNLENRGIEYFGYDGNPHTPSLSNGKGKVLDLAIEQNIPITDGTMCLEVGEHIPLKFANVFLDNVTRSSKKNIILSWGVPDQIGHGHINCQPNKWVIEQMENRSWIYLIEETILLREKSTLRWFENTIMVFENGIFDS